MKTKIAIIGTGTFASALGKILHDGGHHNVILYGIDQQELTELKVGKNTKYYPLSVKLPHFQTTDDLALALSDITYLILAIPSKVIMPVFEKILPMIKKPVLVVNAIKGSVPDSENTLHVDLENKVKNHEHVRGIVSLLGPGHAEEIVKECYTAVAIIARDQKLSKEVQKLFNNDYFRTYVQTDIIGAEAGAIYKNVLAIAAGIVAGLNLGINTTAALLTRGMAEMKKFNQALGGKPETIYGLTGIGDLIVTATSDLSRNYQFGYALAKKGATEALKTTKTVEGLAGLNFIKKIAKRHHLDLPINQALYEVIYENKTIKTAIENLWKRDLKAE